MMTREEGAKLMFKKIANDIKKEMHTKRSEDDMDDMYAHPSDAEWRYAYNDDYQFDQFYEGI